MSDSDGYVATVYRGEDAPRYFLIEGDAHAWTFEYTVRLRGASAIVQKTSPAITAQYAATETVVGAVTIPAGWTLVTVSLAATDTDQFPNRYGESLWRTDTSGNTYELAAGELVVRGSSHKP